MIRSSYTKLVMLIPLLAACARATGSADFSPRLAEVRRVYVAPLGSGVDAERVRDRVRQLLSESNRFILVDEAAAADAILSGIAGVKQIQTTTMQFDDATGMTISDETHRLGFGRLYLVAAESFGTVWTFQYRIGMSFEKPAIRVANQAVQRLLANAAEADRASAIPRASPR
jgi:hypothetical protein